MISDRIEKAITVDEIGIEIGHYGPYVLKTAIQPIFRLTNRGLEAVAGEALVRPLIGGTEISPMDFFRNVAPGERLLVEALCRALHLRNYHNIGAEGIELFFNFNPRAHHDVEAAIERLAYMIQRLGDIGVDPKKLVCEITELAALDADTLARLAAEMRRHEIRLAVDDFGVGHSTPARVELIEPDFVKIDGTWFRHIAAVPAAARLLGPLISSLHQNGTEVLIEGIASSSQLRIALDAGADLLQGFLLARPALAGAVFPTEPIDPARLLSPGATDRQGGKVVNLFG